MILQSRDNCSASELDLRHSNTYSSESGFALGVTPLENNDVDDVMGAAYWIPAFWVPALLVTHYITFVVLITHWKDAEG